MDKGIVVMPGEDAFVFHSVVDEEVSAGKVTGCCNSFSGLIFLVLITSRLCNLTWTSPIESWVNYKTKNDHCVKKFEGKADAVVGACF